jgi:hypothetical protein
MILKGIFRNDGDCIDSGVGTSFSTNVSCESLCHNNDRFLLDAVVASALIVGNFHQGGIDTENALLGSVFAQLPIHMA